MPRLAQINIENAEQDTKTMLEGIQEKMGKVPNIFQGMANSPATLGFYLQGSGALSNSKLNATEREAIALIIAQVNECNYCLAAHTAIGAGAGISAEESINIRKNAASDAKTQALIAFAVKVQNSKGFVSDADIAEFKAAGYGDAEASEVAAIVAMNIFTNFFNHINDTEVDFPAAQSI